MNPDVAPPSLDGYEVFECIGVGGLGAVFRGRQRSTGVEVAIKMVRSTEDDSIAWRRTERELRALAGLRGHAHVVGVLEVVPTGNYRALVVDYAPGGSIHDLATSSGPLDIAEIIFVGHQVADALDAAHERGIVHRDIKPHNLLIDGFGQIKVCDFGVASLLGEDEFRDRTTGLSVRYASPEDVEDEPGGVGPPSDIYSLGATLLFLRRGAPPTTIERVAGWVPPTSVGDGAGASIDALIAECLSLDPLERPTARVVRSRLSELESRLDRPLGALGVNDDARGSDRPMADGDATFLPPSSEPADFDADPESDTEVDSTGEREMLAEFRAAMRTIEPPVEPVSVDPDSVDSPAAEFWGKRDERTVRRPEAKIAASWPRPVIAAVATVLVIVAVWAIARRESRSTPPQPVSSGGSQASSPRPTALPGMVAEVAPPTTAASGSLVVVDRPTGLDDLAALDWPVAERGLCLVQRPTVNDLEAVSCDQPHDLQSLGSRQVNEGASDLDDDEIRDLAADLCLEMALGVTELVREELLIDATVPSAASWAGGDREVQCWIRASDRRMVGDALG